MEKTAYELHMSDWSSDVCSSDLYAHHGCGPYHVQRGHCWNPNAGDCWKQNKQTGNRRHRPTAQAIAQQCNQGNKSDPWSRSEEHTSELQSLMRFAYAVFCVKKNTSNYAIRVIKVSTSRHTRLHHLT